MFIVLFKSVLLSIVLSVLLTVLLRRWQSIVQWWRR